jgi:hemerythrin-like metal-binding protein
MSDDKSIITLKLIEKHHEELAAFVHDAGRPQSLSESDVEKLLSDTERHFLAEEAFMASFDYPDLGGHKWQHEVLLNDLRNLVSEVREHGGIAASAKSMYVLRLLLEHNLEIDNEFIQYFRTHA